MADLKSLQADARAKLQVEMKRLGMGGLARISLAPSLDEIILSTVLAVREETKLEETHAGDDVPSWKDYNRGWNNASAAQDRRFDSLLGGDAKSV